MNTALSIVTRIITSQAVGNIVQAAGRAVLRAAAKEVLRAATSNSRPRYPRRVRTDRA